MIKNKLGIIIRKKTYILSFLLYLQGFPSYSKTLEEGLFLNLKKSYDPFTSSYFIENQDYWMKFSPDKTSIGSDEISINLNIYSKGHEQEVSFNFLDDGGKSPEPYSIDELRVCKKTYISISLYKAPNSHSDTPKYLTRQLIFDLIDEKTILDFYDDTPFQFGKTPRGNELLKFYKFQCGKHGILSAKQITTGKPIINPQYIYQEKR